MEGQAVLVIYCFNWFEMLLLIMYLDERECNRSCKGRAREGEEEMYIHI